MPDVVVRKAEPQDVEEIFELSSQLTTVKDRKKRWSKLFKAMGSANHAVLVAKDGSDVVGYLNANVRISILDECRSYVVDGLYVAEGRRNEGIGNKLVRALQKMAKQNGIGRIVVQTSANNEAAKATYKGCGFNDKNVLEFCWISSNEEE